jgi:hypothetical protein
MNAPINNEWNNFAIGISQDGNVLYLGNVYKHRWDAIKRAIAFVSDR